MVNTTCEEAHLCLMVRAVITFLAFGTVVTKGSVFNFTGMTKHQRWELHAVVEPSTPAAAAAAKASHQNPPFSAKTSRPGNGSSEALDAALQGCRGPPRPRRSFLICFTTSSQGVSLLIMVARSWVMWTEQQPDQFSLFYLFLRRPAVILHVLPICMCSPVVRAELPFPVITIQTEQSYPFLSFLPFWCFFWLSLLGGRLLRKPRIIFSSLAFAPVKPPGRDPSHPLRIQRFVVLFVVVEVVAKTLRVDAKFFIPKKSKMSQGDVVRTSADHPVLPVIQVLFVFAKCRLTSNL